MNNKRPIIGQNLVSGRLPLLLKHSPQTQAPKLANIIHRKSELRLLPASKISLAAPTNALNREVQIVQKQIITIQRSPSTQILPPQKKLPAALPIAFIPKAYATLKESTRASKQVNPLSNPLKFKTQARIPVPVQAQREPSNFNFAVLRKMQSKFVQLSRASAKSLNPNAAEFVFQPTTTTTPSLTSQAVSSITNSLTTSSPVTSSLATNSPAVSSPVTNSSVTSAINSSLALSSSASTVIVPDAVKASDITVTGASLSHFHDIPILQYPQLAKHLPLNEFQLCLYISNCWKLFQSIGKGTFTFEIGKFPTMQFFQGVCYVNSRRWTITVVVNSEKIVVTHYGPIGKNTKAY